MLTATKFKMFQGMVAFSTGDGRWFTVKEEQQLLAKGILNCLDMPFVKFDINENDDAVISEIRF